MNECKIEATNALKDELNDVRTASVDNLEIFRNLVNRLKYLMKDGPTAEDIEGTESEEEVGVLGT